jgi:hypothetical protein
MPDDDEIIDNILRVIESSPVIAKEEADLDDLLADLGFDTQSLRELAFTFNRDDYFRPLGIGLIPDDVADCVTVVELVELVKKELNNEPPPRRGKRDR